MFALLLLVLVSVDCQFANESIVMAIIAKKEAAVSRICDGVREYYQDIELPSRCPRFEQCDPNLKATILDDDGTMECQHGFGTDGACGCDGRAEVSFDRPSLLYADPSSKDSDDVTRFVCFTNTLRTIFQENQVDDPEICWQYVGGPMGVYNGWPAVSSLWSAVTPVDSTCKNDQVTCPDYDPRIRPWYVAAASGPKDLVMVLDVSGSMADAGRLALLKDAAKTVVKGLGIYDRLSIVTFSTSADTCNFAGENFMQTTDANKLEFNDCIGNLGANLETNFEAGFDMAFNIIEGRSYDENTCHTVILFLTDGVITKGLEGKDFLKFVEERNTPDIGAKIFSFSLGDLADTKVPKALACAHSGVWIPVEDSGDLRTQMSSYYNYFVHSDHTRTPTWSEKYEDAFGLGWMTTAAQGCFDENNNFYAVAGVDVLLTEFEQYADFDTDIQEVLHERSFVCKDIELTPEQLEDLRVSKCDADMATIIVVATVIPTVLIIAVVVIIVVIVVVCCVISSRAAAGRNIRHTPAKNPEIEMTAAPRDVQYPAATTVPVSDFGVPPPGGSRVSVDALYNPMPVDISYEPSAPPGYS